jgi:hypothetical protein
MKLQKLFYLLVFVGSTIQGFAQLDQDKVLNDLVPFKKGKKWGLVHYSNGKEFYKPVFDTVVFDYSNDYGAYSVFQKEENDLLAKVVFEKKKMWLTVDKKLKPADYYLEGYEENEEVVEEGIMESIMPVENLIKTDEKIVIENFNSTAGSVQVEKFRDTFHIYMNGEEQENFRCQGYSKIEKKYDGTVNYLKLRINGKDGLVNLTTRKFAIPAEQEGLEWHTDYEAISLYKNHLAGVADLEGNIIVPQEYDNIYAGSLLADGSRVFCVVKDKAFFFVKKANGDALVSTVHYDYLQPVFVAKQLLYLAIKKENTGLVDISDHVLIPLQYADLRPAGEIVKLYSHNELWGFADPANNYSIFEPRYSELSDAMPINFLRNMKRVYLFGVRKNGQYFYIDNHGREFISK